METTLHTSVESIRTGVLHILPEVVLALGIVTVLLSGFFSRTKKHALHAILTLLVFVLSLVFSVGNVSQHTSPLLLFSGFIRLDHYALFFKLLFGIGGILTVLMSLRHRDTSSGKFISEYYALLLSAVLGAHLLAMSINFVMVFLSLELLSISAYLLAGYSFAKKGAEASLKYFLFGSVASAIMLYGFSILFGITGTVDFSSAQFAEQLTTHPSTLLAVAGLMALAGFLYKIAAAPMHVWSPDVYEATPLPVLAFFSTVPKLAGLAVLSRFIVALNAFGESAFDWQFVLGVVAVLTLTVGNFSALWQNNAKRMMAYSSIAQSGFLLIGLVCFSEQGIQTLLFYSTVYLLTNFAVLIGLQVFERNGLYTLPDFSGQGRYFILLSVLLAIGLISLAGIPPTGGFTSKLFVFAALWGSYEQSGKIVLLVLLVFGLLNTVISLFYYLKIPYYAFLKNTRTQQTPQNTTFENFLALILVLAILFIFIRPDMLMGWLNTINFVL